MKKFHEGVTTFADWFAYALSIGASIFFATFIIGEGLPSLTDTTMLIFSVILLAVMAGSVLAIFKRIPGSIIMLAGGISLFIYFMVGGHSQLNMSIAYGMPYIISGTLLLAIRK
ncbi:MAG: hypothetical protein Q8928_07785 [Bacteroidota bacterium]|nr:hypothetical protein [Bacteroidota bacterium]